MRRTLLPAVSLTGLLTISCQEDPAQVARNTAPEAAIVSPAPGATFSGGDDLAVEISGSDEQEGVVAETRLSWWAVLHHDTHTHPFLPPATGSGGTASIPRVGHLETNIWYRVYARAEDAEGLVDTVFVDVTPNLVTLAVESVPSGLEVTVDGQPRTTPVDIESVVGMERVLGASSPQSTADSMYAFSGWSQGGAQDQTYVAPAGDVTLTATFDAVGVANEPPVVSVTSPSDGATVIADTPIDVTADASDPDGSVASVQFLEGANVLGTDDTAPYAVQWTPTWLGARTLTAVATDDAGVGTTSAEVDVTVQASGPGDVEAPVATLTSPAHGTLGMTGSVLITATATDNVGVTGVEFQVDGETIGTDTTEPYEATLPATADYTTGAHALRVRATDAAGNESPWSSVAVTFGGDVDLPAGFTRTTYASGFSGFLTAAAFAPDGRLFVLEQGGAVRIVENGALLTTPFETIAIEPGGERGLLGIALDPDFATNGYVYFYYTSYDSGAFNRISRFTADGNTAVPGSEVVLVDLEKLSNASNHNGGAMAFGPDGKLYVAVGDNAQPQLAQSLTSRFGKILRYDSDGSIPADNPLIGSTSGEYQAIWATGLRNPYTFAFEAGTGRMHVNDVGQDAWEEINLGVPGGNYGWPATEGPTANPAYLTPVLAYHHFISPTLFNGFAIVGGAFYHPVTDLFGPTYAGDYFFADYVGGWVYRLESDGWEHAYAFAQIEPDITNLVLGDDGALYVLVGSRVDRIGR